VDRDIDGAARDVQAAIVAAHADLPSALTRKSVLPQDQQFAVSGDGHRHDIRRAHTGADLRRGGRGDFPAPVADPGGGRSQRQRQRAAGGFAWRSTPKPYPSNGIGLQDVRAAISNANANAPKGAIEILRPALPDLYQRQRAGRGAVPESHHRHPNGSWCGSADVAEVLDMQDGATENVRTYGL